MRNDDQDDPQEVIVAIQDTGIGIKPEHLKLLFAPFSQLDTSICRKFGGSGLGLAISRRLCSAMGGSIECESEPGRGSTFTCRFRLPVVEHAKLSVPPEAALEPLVPSQQASGTERAAVDASTDTRGQQQEEQQDKFPGLKVLLVEDNAINQKVGKRMLTALGCTVTVADNGAECVKLMAEKDGEFDVVLMDCQMPVMDGFQATEHIRAVEAQQRSGEGQRKRLPIIALTASATKEYEKRCLDVGMSDVLFKPLHREDLAAALRKWRPPPPGADRPTNPFLPGPPPARPGYESRERPKMRTALHGLDSRA